MPRLTVVQLLPALESGGVERSTLEIAQALVEAGHRAIVVSKGGRLVPRLVALGATHVELDIGRKSLTTFRHVRALRALFVRERADIVHARSRLPAWIGELALRSLPAATRPRWITTVHGLNSPSRYSAVMTRGERVICVSGTVREYVLRHYPQVDPSRLRVIERGIDPSMFPRAPRPDADARAWAAAQHPALGGDGPLLLLPGRGTRLKGHADALALLGRPAGRTACDARLWLPGAREAGREAYIADLELEAALGWLSPMRLRSPRRPTPSRAPTRPATWCCSCRTSPKRSGAPSSRQWRSDARCWAGTTAASANCCARWQPAGAVAPFDIDELHRKGHELLTHPPSPAATIPHSLRAMQEATLAVYAELVDEPRR